MQFFSAAERLRDDFQYRFETSIYDKTDKFAEKGVELIQYPDVDSAISEQCKYGLVFSQACRYATRSTQKMGFFFAMKKLLRKLIVKGYHKGKLMRQYSKFADGAVVAVCSAGCRQPM